MQKKTVIKKIKQIIQSQGSLSTAELESGSSPVYATLGQDSCALVERFNLNDVEVIVYAHEQEVDSFSLSYEELEKDVLEEILFELEQYEVAMDKTMERCKS